jgi:hypothetical protein
MRTGERGGRRDRRPRYLPPREHQRPLRRARYLPSRRGAGRPGYLPARGGRGRGGGAGIVILLLVLIGAGLLIWFLATRGDGGANGSTAASGGAAAEGNVTTSNGDDVLAAAANGSSALDPFEDETVRATGAEVQAVVSDQAFWIGRGEAERILVVASGTGDIANVSGGDRVDVSGVLRVLPLDFESRFGVSGADSSQLSDQGHYIEALSVQPAGS